MWCPGCEERSTPSKIKNQLKSTSPGLAEQIVFQEAARSTVRAFAGHQKIKMSWTDF